MNKISEDINLFHVADLFNYTPWNNQEISGFLVFWYFQKV